MIPFLDVGAANREVASELSAALDLVASSNALILGPELERFEQELSLREGSEHCIGVANGLDALFLSLMATGVQPGDEVLVPAHTFIATWLAVSRVGAIPVPVEPTATGYNMDPHHANAQISSRTTAIVPVHLYGEPAMMAEINDLAESKGLAVVADAAQAIGASSRGMKLGQLAQTSTLSFYPAKNLGALGDGGAVLTQDAQLAAKLRRLRNYGSETKYVHDELGFNSRLDELQAAFLRVKLTRVSGWNQRRSEIATEYSAELSGTGLILPEISSQDNSSWHLYVVRSRNRGEFVAGMLQQGVQTQIHYPIPPHKQGAYADSRYVELPITEAIANEVVSLPIGPHLSPNQVEYVVSAAIKVARTTESG